MQARLPLQREALERELHTRIVGRRLYWYEAVESTNTALLALAAQGAPDGAVAVAEYQTGGRGRGSRRWWAPPRTCLLFSILFRPAFPLPPAQSHQLTMLCSLATCDAVAAVAGLSLALKWPNDLLLAGRKVGGILTEGSFTGGRLSHVVVGVGLNVNVDFAARPAGADAQELAGLAEEATSLMAHLGRPVDRTALLRAILERVDARYRRLGEGERFHEEWSQRLATLGQQVRVHTGTETLVGVAEAVDEGGALLLRLGDGSLRRILAGDVARLRPA
ncbi:MAG: biotin--[acetyl-CoA-carboxylase] ligase [Anaerolineae bacterium]|nr:biotin--[acetyl-CoA-carboxylase] ligase [Anaerolineae bacterium]